MNLANFLNLFLLLINFRKELLRKNQNKCVFKGKNYINQSYFYTSGTLTFVRMFFINQMIKTYVIFTTSDTNPTGRQQYTYYHCMHLHS